MFAAPLRRAGQVALALGISLVTFAGPLATADQPSKKEVLRKARSATVYIVVPGRGAGTGFVVDRAERLVVTCAHVLGTRGEARVYFPLVKGGKVVAERKAYDDAPSVSAVVVDLDAARDMCVLRLDRLPAEAAVVSLAKDSAEAGEDIFSIGNPGSSSALWVYTSGTVRQVYRKQARLKSGQLIDALTVETQAPINPGDSGGPVFNAAGDVVGINSYYNPGATLVSACIDVTEVHTALKAARQWLRAFTPAELRKRADHYLKLGLHLRALTDLDRIVDMRPDANAHVLRADALVQAAPTLDFPNRAFALAVTDCVQGIRLDPDNAQAWAVRGAAFLGMGAADQAVADYTEAIRLQPNTADHFIQRGLSYSRRKDTSAALKDFDRALELDPKANRARVLRARALLDAREYTRAIASFDEAIDAEPNVPSLYDYRGDAYLGLRRYDRAVQDYTKALELLPDAAVFLIDRAHAYNELQQHQSALADCDKVLSAQAQNLRALYERGRAAYGLGRHAAALEDATKAANLPTTSAADRQTHLDALILRGRVHLFGTKEPDESANDLTRALEYAPENPLALNLRGLAHHAREDFEQAVKDFTAVLKMEPRNFVVLTNRAISLLKLDRAQDAVKDLTAAIEANSAYVPAYQERARAYEMLDQRTKARADTAKVSELNRKTKSKSKSKSKE